MKRLCIAVLMIAAAGAASADWRYGSDTDKMTDKKTSWANIESNNSLSLEFPYAGKNYGTIYVRQHPKSGLNVMVSVDKGQILCHSYSRCSVTVRFDEGKPIAFSGVGPSDHSSDTVFLQNEAKFVAEARKAKRILVALTMYRAGEQVLDFHSSTPLDWGPKPAAKAAGK